MKKTITIMALIVVMLTMIPVGALADEEQYTRYITEDMTYVEVLGYTDYWEENGGYYRGVGFEVTEDNLTELNDFLREEFLFGMEGVYFMIEDGPFGKTEIYWWLEGDPSPMEVYGIK